MRVLLCQHNCIAGRFSRLGQASIRQQSSFWGTIRWRPAAGRSPRSQVCHNYEQVLRYRRHFARKLRDIAFTHASGIALFA